MQLNDLKIQTLIEFSKDDSSKGADFKEKEFEYKRIGKYDEV